MQVTLMFIIPQGRYQLPSPSLCNINKVNKQKVYYSSFHFDRSNFFQFGAQDGQIEHYLLNATVVIPTHNTYSKPSPQHLRRWKHAVDVHVLVAGDETS